MDAAPTPPLPSRRPSPLLAALLGWVLPGLGHVYAGRPRKGLFLFAVIVSTYLGGLVLAEFRCVSWERDPFWFAAQGVAAGPTALVAWLTRDLAVDRLVPTFDVGLLYVSVASLLNAVAVADALGIVDEQGAALAEHEAENARIEAALRAAALEGATPPEATHPPVPPKAPPHAPPPSPPPGEAAPPSHPGLLPRADLPDFGGTP
jgi:TM2 domain-containing membrane protein YozV